MNSISLQIMQKLRFKEISRSGISGSDSSSDLVERNGDSEKNVENEVEKTGKSRKVLEPLQWLGVEDRVKKQIHDKGLDLDKIQ